MIVSCSLTQRALLYAQSLQKDFLVLSFIVCTIFNDCTFFLHRCLNALNPLLTMCCPLLVLYKEKWKTVSELSYVSPLFRDNYSKLPLLTKRPSHPCFCQCNDSGRADENQAVVAVRSLEITELTEMLKIKRKGQTVLWAVWWHTCELCTQAAV